VPVGDRCAGSVERAGPRSSDANLRRWELEKTGLAPTVTTGENRPLGAILERIDLATPKK